MCHLLLKSKYFSSRMKIKYNFNDNYACIFILTYLQGLIWARCHGDATMRSEYDMSENVQELFPYNPR